MGEGGIAPPDIDILQVAKYYQVLPDDVENMSVEWFNRTLIFLTTKAEADKEDG